jgi:RES domain
VALNPPPPDLDLRPLTVASVSPSRLYRISRHNNGEPYFGRAKANRFDDPSGSFGTCYFGFDLTTAIAETVIHDEVPIAGQFELSQSDFDSRFLVRFTGGTLLKLANMTGASLLPLGANGAISTKQPYDLPQQWSEAIHNHHANVDGMLFMSRQVNNAKAVVVFERAKAKIGQAAYTALTLAPNVANSIKTLNLTFPYP